MSSKEHQEGSISVLYGRGEWTEIGGSATDNNEDKEKIERKKISIRQFLKDLVDSDALVVLAGSGASMGIRNKTGSEDNKAPSMGDLYGAISEHESFQCIAGIQNNTSSHDVEGTQNAGNCHDKNDQLLSSEALNSKNIEKIISEAELRVKVELDDDKLRSLKNFVNFAARTVWDKCNFINNESDLSTHQAFLRKIGRRSTRLQRTQIFTTNYDLAFETAAESARFHLIDGFGFGHRVFDGASFDVDFVRRNSNEPPTLEPNVVKLLKMHGSVDWRYEDGRVVRDPSRVPSDEATNDLVLIYPSSTKYQSSYKEPYLEFMSRFQLALRQRNLGLIVVGFGFNDDHITAPIMAALRSNVGLRAVFVSPDIKVQTGDSCNPKGNNEGKRSKEDHKNVAFATIDSLIKWGDNRLALINCTFDDFVRLLPQSEVRDEREIHAELIEKLGKIYLNGASDGQ